MSPGHGQDGNSRVLGVRAAVLVVIALGLVLMPLLLQGLTPMPRRERAAGPVAGPVPGPNRAPQVQVRGNQFVDDAGNPLRLKGFNFPGAEYTCVEDNGIFDAPRGRELSPSVVDGMRSWRGANVVRLNLNQQCWLGVGGVDRRYAGQNYQRAIAAAVAQLNAAGLAVVLDLHRSAPGDARPLNTEPMADRDHSLEFWTQVATAYRDNLSVLFDLFNEPFLDGGRDTAQAWRCWRDGGCRLESRNGGGRYVAAGMNEMVAAVRATGARNAVLAGGLNHAEVLSRWLEYRPDDPTGNVAASVHVYSFNECSGPQCYDGDMAAVADQVPLFVGEFGPDLTISTGFDADCPRSAIGDTGFVQDLFDWMDARGVSYAAWAYNVWPDCWALVNDWSGSPTTPWGEQVRARLRDG